MTKENHSLNLIINDKMEATLAKLVEDSNASGVAEIITNAIALYAWASEQIQEGCTVGSLKDGKPVTEVILPFQAK